MTPILFSTGVFLILFLIADATGLASSHPVFSAAEFRPAYRLVSGLAALFAVGISAWCLKCSLQIPANEDRYKRYLWIALSVVLLLCTAVVTFRHGILTTATGRAPEDHLPVGVFLGGIVAGLLLALLSTGKTRKVGWAFMITIPLLMIGSFYLGVKVDFARVTDNRAARIGAALECYRLDHGAYPAELAALTPRYLPILLGPLTGRGQVWCYQADSTSYRLGYAFFQRYYDWGDGVTPFVEPYFAIKTPLSVGQPTDDPWMCDSELELLKIHRGL